jgi:glucosyl-dolichyl phosphate glucuronosyltransferase
MVQLKTSVVICVYTENRWNEIQAAVESVRRQSIPPAEILVVVDHNLPLFERITSAMPDVTVLENTFDRGLSGGKNTGLMAATGEVVAFLDDDATAEPDWLKYLLDGYAEAGVVGVGGLTVPNWETSRPRWFPEEFDWTVGCTYVGMPRFRAPVRNLLGGNASFRREVFDVAGLFRTDIGRSASKRPLGCEETEFCIRLTGRAPQSVLLFEHRAAIHHLVPAARCRFSYFVSRCYAEGLSKAQVTASVGVNHGLSSERRYTSRTLPLGVARGVGCAVRGDIWGLARAGAIVAGLCAACTGYISGSVGKVRRRARSRAPLAGNAPERETA